MNYNEFRHFVLKLFSALLLFTIIKTSGEIWGSKVGVIAEQFIFKIQSLAFTRKCLISLYLLTMKRRINKTFTLNKLQFLLPHAYFFTITKSITSIIKFKSSAYFKTIRLSTIRIFKCLFNSVHNLIKQ
jgi:hypothetical protein